MKTLFNLAIYIAYALPLYLIALKCGHPLAWLSFVPLANLWLMCDLTDLSLAILLLFFVPVVGAIVVQVMVWTRLAENCNKPSWLGILMAIPFISSIVGWYIAVAPS